MHGIVFAELQKFVSKNHGPQTWQELLQRAGLGGKMYLPVNEYPDSEIKSLVGAASAMSGRPVPEVLEAFGDFITPSLIGMYGHLLSPEWKALDVIEHTEGSVHTVVRVRNPGVHPPRLKSRRVSPNEVAIVYTSPRQMCFLAIGIGRGIGRHFSENLSIHQNKCMHKGDPFCEISYRKFN